MNQPTNATALQAELVWHDADDRHPPVKVPVEVELDNGNAMRAYWEGARWIVDGMRLCGVERWRYGAGGLKRVNDRLDELRRDLVALEAAVGELAPGLASASEAAWLEQGAAQGRANPAELMFVPIDEMHDTVLLMHELKCREADVAHYPSLASVAKRAADLRAELDRRDAEYAAWAKEREAKRVAYLAAMTPVGDLTDDDLGTEYSELMYQAREGREADGDLDRVDLLVAESKRRNLNIEGDDEDGNN